MVIEAGDRGAKHRCFNCQTLFYDLKRPKHVCPRCGADQADEVKAKPAPSRKGKKAAAPVVAKPPEPEAEEPSGDEDEDAPVEDADDDEVDDDDEPEGD